MVDAGDESDFGRFERVIGGKVDVKEENPSCVGGVLRTDNRGLPVELILLVLGAS